MNSASATRCLLRTGGIQDVCGDALQPRPAQLVHRVLWVRALAREAQAAWDEVLGGDGAETRDSDGGDGGVRAARRHSVQG